MIALPKKVWVVVLLLTLAVISLWLMFLKKELRQEQSIKTSLKEVFGSKQPAANDVLQQTRKFLDQQFDQLAEAVHQPSSTASVTADNLIDTSSTTSAPVK